MTLIQSSGKILIQSIDRKKGKQRTKTKKKRKSDAAKRLRWQSIHEINTTHKKKRKIIQMTFAGGDDDDTADAEH